MSNDLIPHTDADFDVFQRTFTAAVVADPARFGLTAADGAQLVAAPSDGGT